VIRLALPLAVIALAAPALAQNAQAPAAQPTAPAARFTLDTPVEQLVADAQARAVLEANVPGLAAHPMYEMFKTMSLRQLQPMSQGRLTDEIMNRLQTALTALR
jgi:hypothetical protein